MSVWQGHKSIRHIHWCLIGMLVCISYACFNDMNTLRHDIYSYVSDMDSCPPAYISDSGISLCNTNACLTWMLVCITVMPVCLTGANMDACLDHSYACLTWLLPPLLPGVRPEEGVQQLLPAAGPLAPAALPAPGRRRLPLQTDRPQVTAPPTRPCCAAVIILTSGGIFSNIY